MSSPWKPLVQKTSSSPDSWGRKRAKQRVNLRASGVATLGHICLAPAGTPGSAPWVALGHLCLQSHWEVGMVALLELQSYHEGVGLGTECVGEPIDGEGHVRHGVEVAALHGVL